MKKYYCLRWNDATEVASAFYEDRTQLDHEMISQLEGKKQMPLDFVLTRVKETRNGLIIDDNLTALKEVWLDYQPNSLAWPILSEKLKNIIDASLTGNEQVDWITCNLRNREEVRQYYIIRFNKKMDVYDIKKTVFMDETKEDVIKPVFSFSKIKNYSVFPKPLFYDFWKFPTSFYVNEDIKKRIQKEKLTGIKLEKVFVSE